MSKMNNMLKGACVMILMGVSVACKHKPDLAQSPEISFSGQVQPLIISNCCEVGCHSGYGDDAFTLLTYSEVRRHVKPGKPYRSSIFQSVVILSGEGAMPPGRPLSEDQLKIMYTWIAQGAKNN